MKAHFQRMAQATIWADSQTLDAVKLHPASQAETLPLVAHLLAAEHVWLSRLLGRSSAYPVWPQLTLEECDTLAQTNATELLDFLEKLETGSEYTLETEVTYQTSNGDEYTTPIIDILSQMILHGPYHRGQIAKIIGKSGGTPINTDYITFARKTGK